MKRSALVVGAVGVLLAIPEASAQHDPAAHAQFGKVVFPTSCSPAVQGRFEDGVSKLHSFFFPETVKAFQAVIDADPQCAMGY